MLNNVCQAATSPRTVRALLKAAATASRPTIWAAERSAWNSIWRIVHKTNKLATIAITGMPLMSSNRSPRRSLRAFCNESPVSVLCFRKPRADRTCSFRALVADADSTLVIVARFLALLELYKEGAITFDQAEPLADLAVRWTGTDEGEITVDDEFDEGDQPTAGDEGVPPTAGDDGQSAVPADDEGHGIPKQGAPDE